MSPTEAFIAALSERTAWVNEALFAPGLLDSIRPQHLAQLVRAYLERGGKRLRPAVLLFCCGAVGGAEEDVVPAAAALEMFHTWTLMHDDIIDHDHLRRGGPTGHVLGADLARQQWGLADHEADDYGRSLSLLAGDVQHALCVRLFLSCENIPAPLLLHLTRELEGQVVADLVEGETLDIQLGHRPVADVRLDEVLRMLYLKTGALYEFAGKAGAMLGLRTTDATHPLVEALRTFCAHCGTAFQLQDDILGILGDEDKLGKPVGSDITEGKRTPVLLAAYEAADEATRKRLDQVLGNRDANRDQIQQTIQTICSLGAVERVRALAQDHIAAAHESLRKVPPSQYTQWLGAWANFMIEREL